MAVKRDDWEKPRAKGVHLTPAEISKIRVAFNTGRHPSDIARELQCSSRIANKYYAQFRGYAVPRGRLRTVVVRPPEPKPAARARFYTSTFELEG